TRPARWCALSFIMGFAVTLWLTCAPMSEHLLTTGVYDGSDYDDLADPVDDVGTAAGRPLVVVAHHRATCGLTLDDIAATRQFGWAPLVRAPPMWGWASREQSFSARLALGTAPPRLFGLTRCVLPV